MLLEAASAANSSLIAGYISVNGASAAAIMLALPVPHAIAKDCGLKNAAPVSLDIVEAIKLDNKLQNNAPKTVPVI